MRAQAQEDGYVECTECGHPIEQHDGTGCEVCQTGGVSNCPTRWTRAEIMTLRQREGLSPTWEL